MHYDMQSIATFTFKVREIRKGGIVIKRILCLCVANISRSPMLEGLLKEAILREIVERTRIGRNYSYLQEVTIESAGTYMGVSPNFQGNPADSSSVACMKELRIHIEDHKSRPISMVDLNKFQLIVCMSDDEIRFISGLTPRFDGAIMLANAANGGIPDPHGKDLQTYRECAKTLQTVADYIVNVFL